MVNDTIILAAGENVRLQAAGLPPSLKPLLMYKGEVLLRRLARQAAEAGSSRIVVVASPTNAEYVAYATKGFATDIVLQLEPRGPQDAVDTALTLLLTPLVCLLMGDNWCDDIYRFVHAHQPRINVILAAEQVDADRYTPVDSEGCIHNIHKQVSYRWLGPLVVDTMRWKTKSPTWREALYAVSHELCYSTALDLGIPEAWE